MNSLIEVPVSFIVSLSAEGAVRLIRKVFRAECWYSHLAPMALTISERLTIADGGIDAEISTNDNATIPSDCLFQAGLTGFQIKSGSSFKAWTVSSIRGELLDSRGVLRSEVARLIQRRGRYILLCTGHDLTPGQRNDAKKQIGRVLSSVGHQKYDDLIDVLGASQLAEFIERYPAIASSIIPDPIQEALVLDEWRQSAHMSNQFEMSIEQAAVIEQIKAGILGDAKHLRVLGEPGLGKTRIVLEAMRDPNIAPCVLYIEHGSLFGQTKLFRHLLKAPNEKPLVVIIDELPEREMSEIWNHLKTRCGALKLITLDHGQDETRDSEITRLKAPRLSDETINKILINQIGDGHDVNRWVEICEGSPRVAQAVADNLKANPEDLLRPPATVPLWDRFLHGYGRRDELQARQINCVAQHLALFRRFGYEDPVGNEARYIAGLVEEVDSTIGWALFQEIIKLLRARRVLQGSKTLFFVPRALHIYLWKRFWEFYGRGFKFADVFASMPESLHVWFMSMFKFASDEAASAVISDILKEDGIYANKIFFTSANGSRFLSNLAEANPLAVLKLMEGTIGKWPDEELKNFTEHRQNTVWAIEKIAVWTPYVVRAIRLLARLAANESATNSNNATGTLIGMFRIGLETVATESTPAQRLPALLQLLRTPSDIERRLGLQALIASVDTRGLGSRIVGPEYQGLKERAKLWIPQTYGEWHDAYFLYFHALISETQIWPQHLRPVVCSALLDAVEQQIQIPPCTQLALQTLESLAQDPNMDASKLNEFFSHWREYNHEAGTEDVSKKSRRLAVRLLVEAWQAGFNDM